MMALILLQLLFVLDTLQKHQAKATFFCIGKNVQSQPALYNRIIAEGHAVGNHTYNHLNGWKTNDENTSRTFLKQESLLSQTSSGRHMDA
jgi:peptidoglycan/xylan/chitin deacetylase (PgdA/CDA1 family)